MKMTQIEQKRRAYGPTQVGLGKALGIPKTTICNWEQGIYKPAPYLEYLICYWLDKEYGGEMGNNRKL